jgi:hypothetical protein
MPSQQFEENRLLGAEIDTAAAWPAIVHSDDSIVVLNVKEEARIGQKTAPAHCHWCLAADSIDDGLLRWFELLLGTRSSLLWPTL